MTQNVSTSNTQETVIGAPKLHPLSIPGQCQEYKWSSTQQHKCQTTPASSEGKKQLMLRAIFYHNRVEEPFFSPGTSSICKSQYSKLTLSYTAEGNHSIFLVSSHCPSSSLSLSNRTISIYAVCPISRFKKREAWLKTTFFRNLLAPLTLSCKLRNTYLKGKLLKNLKSSYLSSICS